MIGGPARNLAGQFGRLEMGTIVTADQAFDSLLDGLPLHGDRD